MLLYNVYYSGLMTGSLTTGPLMYISVCPQPAQTNCLPIVSHDYLLLTMTRLSVVSVISSTSADAISLLIDADRISLYVALDSCFSIYLLSNRVAIHV